MAEKFRELELPEGRTFVVGDIHGCLPELEMMLEHLVLREKIGEGDLLLFIGDYIDRGKYSSQVVELLIKIRKQLRCQCIFLKGNHEDMLLDYLGLPGGGGPGYLLNGGNDCLSSYGVENVHDREEILEKIGKTHLDFYSELERYVVTSKYVFVHAGLNPLRDLKFQSDEEIFWIRDDFIEHQHFFKKTVVFGHTPFYDILFQLPYKIGLDTGLVYGNLLTCIELKEERIFQVLAGASTIIKTTYKEKGASWPSL